MAEPVELRNASASYDALGRSAHYLAQAEALLTLEPPSGASPEAWNAARSQHIDLGAAYAALATAIENQRDS